MSGKNYYISGDWNIICDVCSKKIKFSKSKKRWDGYLVCPSCYEMRHPQDFVKAKQDKISVSDTRPRPPDVFFLRESLQDQCYALDEDYINLYMLYDPTNMYFLEDYLEDRLSFWITMNWNSGYEDSLDVLDSPLVTYSKAMTEAVAIADSVMIGSVYKITPSDSVSMTESGTILNKNYVESGYFLSDYVGTTYTF